MYLLTKLLLIMKCHIDENKECSLQTTGPRLHCKEIPFQKYISFISLKLSKYDPEK